MSVMPCSTCGTCIDTDFDVEGVWPFDDHGEGPDFVCFRCLEDMDEIELHRLGYSEDFEPLGAMK